MDSKALAQFAALTRNGRANGETLEEIQRQRAVLETEEAEQRRVLLERLGRAHQTIQLAMDDMAQGGRRYDISTYRLAEAAEAARCLRALFDQSLNQEAFVERVEKQAAKARDQITRYRQQAFPSHH